MADETAGERDVREWADTEDVRATSAKLRELAGALDAIGALVAELACPTHCACQRVPGDCCTIGSVIGGWERDYTREAVRAEALQDELAALRARADQTELDGLRAQAHVARKCVEADRHRDTIASLRAALLATRNADAADGPCWCVRPRIRDPIPSYHGSTCLQRRAALGLGAPTPEAPIPSATLPTGTGTTAAMETP